MEKPFKNSFEITAALGRYCLSPGSERECRMARANAAFCNVRKTSTAIATVEVEHGKLVTPVMSSFSKRIGS